MDEDVPSCPLCLEDLDATDRAMQACRCSYSVCSFCLNHIRENLNGLCPACRTPYEESNFTFKEVSTEAAVKEARERAAVKKERERREREELLERERARAAQVSQLKAKTNLKHARFVQRNLVYVIGLSLTLAREEVIRKSDMFGRFGRILRVLINRAHPYNADAPGGPSISAYILFSRDIDASAAVRQMNANVLDGREVRCAIACTKYCDSLVRSGLHCGNADCLYIHEQFASADDVLSREDVLARQLGPPPPAHLFLPVRRRVDVHTHSSRVAAANVAAATAANAAVAANAAAANAAKAAAAMAAAHNLSSNNSSNTSMSAPTLPLHRPSGVTSGGGVGGCGVAVGGDGRSVGTKPMTSASPQYPFPSSHYQQQQQQDKYIQYPPMSASRSGRTPPASPRSSESLGASSRSSQTQLPPSVGWGISPQSQRSPQSPTAASSIRRGRAAPPSPPNEDLKRMRKRAALPVRNRSTAAGLGRQPISASLQQQQMQQQIQQLQQEKSKPPHANVPPGFEEYSSASAAPTAPARPPGFGAPRGSASTSAVGSPPLASCARPRNGSSVQVSSSSSMTAQAPAIGPPGFELPPVVASALPAARAATPPTDRSLSQDLNRPLDGVGALQSNGPSSSPSVASAAAAAAPATADNADAAFSGRGIVLPPMSIPTPYSQGAGSAMPTPSFPMHGFGAGVTGMHPLSSAGLSADLRPSRRSNSRFGFAREEPVPPVALLRENATQAVHLLGQSMPPVGVVGQPSGNDHPAKVKSRFDFADRELSPANGPSRVADSTCVPHLMHLGTSNGANGNGLSVAFSQLSTQDKLASLFQSAQWAADSGSSAPLHLPVAATSTSSSSASVAPKQSTSPLVPPGFREATPELPVSAKTSVTPGVASSNIDLEDGPEQDLSSVRKMSAGANSTAESAASGKCEARVFCSGPEDDREAGEAPGSRSRLNDGGSIPAGDSVVSVGVTAGINQADLTSEVELERQVQAARAREAHLAAQLSELQQQIRHFDNVRT